MVATTPFLKDSDKLGPLASRYLDVAELPWQETRFPGVDMKVLVEDKESGLVTALFRFAPGTQLPYHEHVEIEQTWVLEGTLEDEEGIASAGNFVWRPAGNRHNAHSPNGCLVLSIFLKPNKFLDKDTVGWNTKSGT
ncbi:MAG TPA: cupin domain-containing protein [Hyphomicrobiaceae bacterium]|jgi:anti-sigma factor ChrR (cupin superfamily)|nr:cupin domain-containing protein [Hyphomicrobiaceae bacterium]